MAHTYSTAERLQTRLRYIYKKNTPISYLIGSGLCTANANSKGLGIPSVQDMVKLISESIDMQEERERFECEMKQFDPSTKYQEAFKWMHETMGMTEVEQIVKRAVLKARTCVHNGTLDEPSCQNLEADISNWYTPPALQSLANLFKSYPKSHQARPILTTNFDPLMEIALKKVGLNYTTVNIPADGRYDNTMSSGEHTGQVSVVHLHGYWRGGHETLHTSGQILRERTALQGCLNKQLRDSVLLVIGYGGWADAATRTLIRIILENNDHVDVLWAFYESSEEQIEKNYSELLRQLAPQIGQRVTLFKGVDAHTLIPKVVSDMGVTESSPIVQTSSPIVQTSSPSLPKTTSPLDDSRSPSDTPPDVETWVGRIAELSRLHTTSAKVISVSGFAGHGKSVLVAKFIRDVEEGRSKFKQWDWRDCREERFTLRSQVVGLIKRLSNNNTQTMSSKDEDFSKIVEELFSVLGKDLWVFVFDNVDAYIDYESGEPTQDLQILISRSLSINHFSKFIFTSRNCLTSANGGIDNIDLHQGLTLSECHDLFKNLGISGDSCEVLIKKSHLLTNGHPLYINMVAGRAISDISGTEKWIEEFARGTPEDLSNRLLGAMWDALPSNEHRTVIQVMAEIVRPYPENELGDIVGSMKVNYNRYMKVIRSLTKCKMIVIRSSKSGPQSYDLHPLVRQFVRNRYNTDHRRSVIRIVTKYFDGWILKIKNKYTNTRPPSAKLLLWLDKAELAINSQEFNIAVEALDDVHAWIEDAGYLEDFARVCDMLFQNAGLQTLIDQDIQNLHDVIFNYCSSLVSIGQDNKCTAFLDEYETLIGPNFVWINYCRCRAYTLWFQKYYGLATTWAQKGVDFKVKHKITTKYNCAHELALSLRDGGSPEEALHLFLKNEKLEDVCDPRHSIDEDGSFYGNIGRCLQMLNRLNEALVCYIKSAKALIESNGNNNLGYAYLWISQILSKQGDNHRSRCFYKMAIKMWKQTAPILARNLTQDANWLDSEDDKLTDVIFEDVCVQYLTFSGQ